MITHQITRTQKIVVGEIQENRKEIIQYRKFLIESLLKIDDVSIKVDASSKQILSTLLQLLKKQTLLTLRQVKMKFLRAYYRLHGVLKIMHNIFSILYLSALTNYYFCLSWFISIQFFTRNSFQDPVCIC
jgi:hypothetical protein